MRARHVVCASLALLWLGACSTTAPSLESARPSRDARNAAHFAMLEPGIRLGSPAGDGPFPVVILMHGCGGRSAEGPLNRENPYREALSTAGLAWLSFKSFPLEGRAFRSACGRPPGTIDTDGRVEDLAEVIRNLHRYPRLDPARVGILGFSMGAATVVKATLRLDPARAPGLLSGVALYPGCREFLTTERVLGQRRLLLLLGMKDTWTAAEPCLALAGALRQAGQAVDVFAYPEATHQWDNPASAGGRHLSMGPGRGTTFVRYDPDTTRDSVARAVGHFRATLASEGGFAPPPKRCVVRGGGAIVTRPARRVPEEAHADLQAS